MSKRKTATASLAIAAIMLMAVSSVASAQRPGTHVQRPGPHIWIRGFDNVWIDRAGVNAFTAAPGDRDLVIALAGDDIVDAGDRNDLVYGDGGNDTIVLGPGMDRARGGHGDDSIDAGDGWDRVDGGRGADSIDGGPGLDRLYGSAGPDTIVGGRGPDIIDAGPGDDSVDVVDGRRDLVRCGRGNDSVSADPQDRVGPSCETVVRVAPSIPSPSGASPAHGRGRAFLSRAARRLRRSRGRRPSRRRRSVPGFVPQRSSTATTTPKRSQRRPVMGSMMERGSTTVQPGPRGQPSS